jgi:hypothetical protein
VAFGSRRFLCGHTDGAIDVVSLVFVLFGLTPVLCCRPMERETPLLVACPRCTVAYPEGEPHECADLRRHRRFWPLKLAIGIALSVVGALAALLWNGLAQAGYTDSLVRIGLPVFTIVCLGVGIWLVVTRVGPGPGQ